MNYSPELYERPEFMEKVARKMCEIDGNPHHKNYNKYFKRIKEILPLMNEELKYLKREWQRDSDLW